MKPEGTQGQCVPEGSKKRFPVETRLQARLYRCLSFII